MCGDSFFNMGAGVASSLKKYGKEFLQLEIVEFLGGHDIVCGNIECVLSDKGRDESRLRSVHMRGAGRVADLLAGWNLTLANVANNHILEHGYEAAVDTIDNLLKSGIRVVGAGGANRFREGIHVETICRGGRTFAFIGMCLRAEKYAFNGGAEPQDVIQTVKTLSASGVCVCVSVHWGDEFIHYPSVEQTRLADALIEAGARMIVGHHPHVLQGITYRRGALVAYSLGNFIFDSFIPDCRWSVMLSVDVVDGKPARWRYVPILQDREHRPMLIGNPGKAGLIHEFRRRCTLLNDQQDEEQWKQRYEAEVKIRDICARKSLWTHLLKQAVRIDKKYWPQILSRPIQRRLGLW
jgi:poly-gamma-glutamate synthesis protein (capsule biosynthesis protein)